MRIQMFMYYAMCVYTLVHMHNVCIQMFMYLCMHVCIHVCVYANMCIYLRTCVHTFMHMGVLESHAFWLGLV